MKNAWSMQSWMMQVLSCRAMHACTALHDNTCIIHDCMLAKMPDWSIAPQHSVLMIQCMHECPAIICGHESALMIHRICNDLHVANLKSWKMLNTPFHDWPSAIGHWVKKFQWPMHIDRIQHMTQQSSHFLTNAHHAQSGSGDSKPVAWLQQAWSPISHQIPNQNFHLCTKKHSQHLFISPLQHSESPLPYISRRV